MCIKVTTLSKLLPKSTLIEVSDRWHLRSIYSGILGEYPYNNDRIVRVRVHKQLYNGTKHFCLYIDINRN